MELRPELLPPSLDEEKVARLADLAATIDGAIDGQFEDELAEFNRLAETNLEFDVFQGIYGGEEHEEWVRRLLMAKAVRKADNVTREELVEVVRRAMPQNGYPDAEAYFAVLDVNAIRSNASTLIYSPPDYDVATNTWGGGRMMGDYDPTPEQIVAWALTPDDQPLSKLEE